MRADDNNQLPTPDAATPPARCPGCRSKDLKTTSKVVNADAYWRCCDCGEVWNVGRLQAASRSSRDWPYRR